MPRAKTPRGAECNPFYRPPRVREVLGLYSAALSRVLDLIDATAGGAITISEAVDVGRQLGIDRDSWTHYVDRLVRDPAIRLDMTPGRVRLGRVEANGPAFRRDAISGLLGCLGAAGGDLIEGGHATAVATDARRRIADAYRRAEGAGLGRSEIEDAIQRALAPEVAKVVIEAAPAETAPTDDLEGAILRFVQASGSAGITHSRLRSSLSGKGSPAEITAALERLTVAEKLLSAVVPPPAQGRPGVRLYAT